MQRDAERGKWGSKQKDSESGSGRVVLEQISGASVTGEHVRAGARREGRGGAGISQDRSTVVPRPNSRGDSAEGLACDLAMFVGYRGPGEAEAGGGTRRGEGNWGWMEVGWGLNESRRGLEWQRLSRERLFAPSSIVCLFSAEHQPRMTSLALVSQRWLGRRLTTPPRDSPPSPALSFQLAARPQAPSLPLPPLLARSLLVLVFEATQAGQSPTSHTRAALALLALLAPGRRSQALAYAGARDPLGEGGWESGAALPNWTLESPAETKRRPQSTADDGAKAGEGGKEGRSHLWLGGTRKHPPDPCHPSAIRATNDRRPACWGLGVRANHRPISTQIAVMDLPPMQAGAKLAPPRPTPFLPRATLQTLHSTPPTFGP